METRRFADYDLSLLMLGTVQFGMSYGIANKSGQPDYGDVLAMVKAAIEGGVNCFDTAAAYGNSEEVLGRALRDLNVLDEVVVITKVAALPPETLADDALARKTIEDSVSKSRRRLGIDCLPVVLFHREADAVHLPVLHDLKERGWLRYAGVSCDNVPGPAVDFARNSQVSALQIPANMIDPRHRNSGAFSTAANGGVGVFIRSVFLQGLLVMPEENIPGSLQEVIPLRRRLAEIAEEAGLSLAELAVRYMLSQEGITCVLAGVDTLGQIRDNIQLFNRGPLPADVLVAVDAAVPELPEFILTPAQWPEAKAKYEAGKNP